MKLVVIAASAASIALAGTALAAGTASQNLNISAQVNNNCTIATTAVAFGIYDPIVTNKAGTGADVNNGAGKLTVTCTKKSSGVTLALGNGGNFNLGARRMTDGTDFLAYELYQPPNVTPATACTFPGTTVWNSVNTLNPAAASFDGTAKDFFICGTVAKGQNVEVGSYADVVIATVNF